MRMFFIWPDPGDNREQLLEFYKAIDPRPKALEREIRSRLDDIRHFSLPPKFNGNVPGNMKMDRKDKNKRKPKHKSAQRPEKRKTERHRSPHRHQSGVQDVFTIEASNHPERNHSRSAVQK
ncbi:hypothetical protein NPIL_357121 [Nephila pilipes]|uniref:Uncharacterized protein n=1 Tax=Nephila pilipes TaxID=299642 RepID=A0A8X6Q1Z2_NEPPI|nr:hypothetical protein NPIL_357121 [Nephila pilipes]